MNPEFFRPNLEVGLPTWVAMVQYASEELRAELPQYSSDELREPIRDLPLKRRSQAYVFRLRLHGNLLGLLRRGKLYATGVLSGEGAPRVVPQGDWYSASIDVHQGDHATIRGLGWNDLLHFPTLEAAERSLQRPELKSTPAKRAPAEPPDLALATEKPRFDRKHVEYMFAAMKLSGELKQPPTVAQAQALVLTRFANAPRPIIKSCWKDWQPKRGPRNPRRPP